MIEVIIDFETANPYVDVSVVGSTVYAQHWATEIICLVYNGKLWAPGVSDVGELERLVLDPEVTFVAFNVGFEKDIWREIMVPLYGFPDISNERWHDIQAVAALKSVPLSLEKCLPVFGLGEKDKEGRRITLGLSKFGGRKWKGTHKGLKPLDRSQATLQRVYQYCAKDVDDEVALHRCLGGLPGDERSVWLLDQRINERGITLDRDFLCGAERIVAVARQPLIAEFRELTGVEPTQVGQFGAWLRSNGVDLPDLRKETIAELLGDDDADEGGSGDRPECDVDTLPANARRALAIRSLVGSASIRKISRMAACISADGRVKRLAQYHGTGPGRVAGRLFNHLNFPRGIVRDPATGKAPDAEVVSRAIISGNVERVQELGLALDDGSPANPIQVVASALRHALIPGPGRKFVAGDSAQSQARLVLAIAGQHDKTALLASGEDVYLDMAAQIWNVPKGSLDKDKDVEKRHTGKNSVLGCGFGMGWEKFRDKYCSNQSPEFAQRVIKAYRDEWAPAVPQLWRALEYAAVSCVQARAPREAYGIRYELEDGWLTCRLYDGKKIYYWKPEIGRRLMPWEDEDGEPVWKDCLSYYNFAGGRAQKTYLWGGLLAENVVMGLERQLLVRAMTRCEAENLPVVMNAYDEIVCEPEERYADFKALEQIMTDLPAWAKEIRLPIAVGGWVGGRYRKG